ncbi:hypothetical protein [Deefgea piscis]|uniref:hypothetical protein n=1 Tax=Deefgea piscis TaxID=2739061 RepID=UPI001C821791|nr:hypothetical protein [Deefgea piscis]QZA80937.1 hypothetical protein K4H25_15850 [Deefgea piscis]
MKSVLVLILCLAATIGSAALLAPHTLSSKPSTSQALCQPGDSAKCCWQHLEYRRY